MRDPARDQAARETFERRRGMSLDERLADRGLHRFTYRVLVDNGNGPYGGDKPAPSPRNQIVVAKTKAEAERIIKARVADPDDKLVGWEAL